MEISIKKAKPTDLNNLAVLKQQVWISTYATEGLVEEFSSYVLSEYSVEKVRKSLTDKNKRTFIATINEAIIGCAEVLLYPASPITSVEPCLEITTLYVLEKFQEVGIGKKLLEECLKEIKKMNYREAWLTVYHKNFRAIEFYTKQQFTHVGDTDFLLGKDKHKNYIMLKKIG